jgi:nicotinate-nucleotide adenylyltransferase
MNPAIGVLGGTFDPVHYGHLRPAIDVAQTLGLDHVRLIPSAVPPHREQPLANVKQRLTLLQLAVKAAPELDVDDRELLREGPSYTVDTLKSLRDDFPNNPLYLLLGTDAFLNLYQWHQWESLLSYANIVVMQRPEQQLVVPEQMQSWFEQHHTSSHEQTLNGKVLTLPVTQLAISATQIRALFDQGASPQFLLPDSVIQLIEMLGLYGATTNG